jgi:1-deoxy-D-xylulose-5-phosphate synthase
VTQLSDVAEELRQFLIETVSQTGGHFAAGLGVVELTIALHYVFNSPHDRIVWDVGHQCYPHKILTGRRRQINRIRQKDGLSGFPRRNESVFDTFGVAHAGTSISAALGMVLAAEQKADASQTVAVIGDGALTAGMALEALNHVGDLNANLLVIVNDNNMSISPNVGALSKHLSSLGRKQNQFPSANNFFQTLDFDYFGPVNGHSIPQLIETLGKLKKLTGPRLLHIRTRKGKGYEHAETDPVAYHAVTRFNPAVGVLRPTLNTAPTYTQIFGDWLCDMASEEPGLVGITPAMREGSGLVKFSQRYPERYYDAAIAEQHSVTLAAGFACEGLKPVVAIYSTFLQRAYDQLIHDVALQNLPVLFAIDRAGLVGPDGPTHAGSFDFSYLRCVPNMVVMAPADENECRQMLSTGLRHSGPAAVRYPREKGAGVKVDKALTSIPVGKAELRRQGAGVAILVFGTLLTTAMEAASAINASVVNMRFVKPLDEDMLLAMAASHDLLITIEDNVIAGGAGSAVNECLAANQVFIPIVNLGLPDRFISQGTRQELLQECGLDKAGLLRTIENFYQKAGSAALAAVRVCAPAAAP